MKKRVLPSALLALSLLFLPAGAAQIDDPEYGTYETVFSTDPAPVNAVKPMTVNGLNLSQSTSNVAVDGLPVYPEGYCINQENYYKLRDLAFLLTGKGSAFDVVWDDQNACISMLSGRNYTITGGEMIPSGSTSIYKFVPSYSDVRLNGQLVHMTGYNINNNNYYRIRDVAPLIGFSVDWDKETSTVVINSLSEQESVSEPSPDLSLDNLPSENGNTESESTENSGSTENPETGGSSAVIPDSELPAGIPFAPLDPETPADTTTEPDEPVYPWIGPKIDGTLTILLDPGHGGTDPGSFNPTTKQDENHTNLGVAEYLKEMLEAQGVRVLMTRSSTSETLVGPDRKAYVREICEAGELDLVLSIHHNGIESHKISGTEVYVQPAGLSPEAGLNGNKDSCITSQSLGKRLLRSYMNMGLGLTNRGMKESDSLYMVYVAGEYGIPAVLSEFCFIDNENDIKFIDDPQDLQAEAKAIFDALMELYNSTPY